MNSMSKPQVNDVSSCGCERPIKNGKILSKCKTGFPVTIVSGTEYTVSALTINTKNFKDPCIKFDFATNIDKPFDRGQFVTLTFQMYKLCKGDTVKTKFGPQWIYRKIGAERTETFNFIVCDCDCDSDCKCVIDSYCTYTVVVNTESNNTTTTTINNSTLSALVVEKTHVNDASACGCERPKEDANVILKCKTGFPVTPVFGIDYTVSTLTLNTNNFKDPCIRFDFAGNIIKTNGNNATLTFQMYKLCKGDTEKTKFGPQWVYHKVGAERAETFNFIVCDCDSDCDSDCKCVIDPCCTYTVVVNTESNTTITINNPTLSALVVEKTHVNDASACGCKRPKEDANVILKCKTGFPVTAFTGIELTVSTLTINTKNFKYPCINFDFASNIIKTFDRGQFVTLTFQMYKLCKGDTVRTEFGPQWVYRKIGAERTETFNFIVCGCDRVIDPCCIYTVVVTADGTATINNPTLSALVVEKNCCCK